MNDYDEEELNMESSAEWSSESGNVDDRPESTRRTYVPPKIETVGTVLSLTQMPRSKGGGGYQDLGSFSK